jgi:hypothetical protein
VTEVVLVVLGAVSSVSGGSGASCVVRTKQWKCEL